MKRGYKKLFFSEIKKPVQGFTLGDFKN